MRECAHRNGNRSFSFISIIIIESVNNITRERGLVWYEWKWKKKNL